MSLVATYVRGKDGKMYCNPTLSGKGWFICFDDDDPVELVISNKSKITPKELLAKLGIKHTEISYNGEAGRMFGKGFKVTQAKSYFFEIKNRIDPQYITEHDGIVDREAIHQGVIYDPKT